jgi:hypothetical protein
MSDDPRSWLEATGDEPSPLLRTLLDSAKVDEPQAADVARLTAKLAAALPPGTLTPDGGGGSGGGGGGSGGGATAAGVKGAAGWVIGGGVIIGLAVLGAVAATNPSGAPLAPHATTAAASDIRTELPQVASVVSVATSASANAPILAPTGTSSASPAVPAEAEATMLARGYEELRHGSPQRALAVAAEHARAYPRGSYAQERELIAIEAMVKLGDRAGADARAAAFRRAYPKSSHLPRLATISPEP